MKVRALLLVVCCIFTIGVVAQTYAHHVVFDNSLPSGSLYASEANSIAPSSLEVVDGKVPVDDEHFVSPPNGLRLKWQSATGGDWFVGMRVHDNYGRIDF
ncbi:MAG TPA: hypothetical protein VF135_15210, partial [Terriglobales bacterium]